MNVGICVVRKKFNNAAILLAEGIKNGIRDIIIDNQSEDLKNIDFTFFRLTIHEPDYLYLDPNVIDEFDVIIFPFWIGERLLKINLKELKEHKKDIKIFAYTGVALYCRKPPFDYDFNERKLLKGDLTTDQWDNLQQIDKFLVINKRFPFENEIEVGCGYFDEWIYPDKSKENIVLLDFCKKQWDEPFFYEFKDIAQELLKKCNVKIIQLGTYPEKIPGCIILDRNFIPYHKMCQLYNKSKIWIAMNESFGYSLCDNKLAGNYILIHDKMEIPNFYLRTKHIETWSKVNIVDKINKYIDSYSIDAANAIRDDYMFNFPQFTSWKDCVKRIIDAITSL